MFGGGGRGDPFGNPFEQVHQQMRQMDNMMNVMIGDAFDMLNSFGMGPPLRHPALMDDGQMQGRHASRHNNGNMMMNPFGAFGAFGGPFLGGMMGQMQNIHTHALHDPNSMVLSESTMVSYDGSGQPKVVQSSTRKAGNVKETRKSLYDGGREEISIGHHIGDRTHIVEKKRDKDGHIRQQQKFINLKEDQARQFNEQFKSQARENLNGIATGLFGHRGNGNHAIEGGAGRYSNGVGSRGRRNGAGTSSAAPTPIITVPDDDEDEDEPTRRRNHRYGDDDIDIVYSNNGTGPIIQEIDDTNEGGTAPDYGANPNKRRKGFGGKFFG